MHRQQGFAHRLAAQLRRALVVMLAKDAPGQRVAIGVQPIRGQSHDHVALGHALGQHLCAIDHAHHRAGQVVGARLVHIGHLGSLAAQQHAAGRAAGRGYARHQRGGHGRVELRDCYIVHKEKRARALHQNVVDAVVDDILAHRVVAADRLGHQRLRADAIGRGDQHRLGDRGAKRGREIKTSAERAHAGENGGGMRRADGFGHELRGARPGVDVDAGLLIGRHKQRLLGLVFCFQKRSESIPPFGVRSARYCSGPHPPTPLSQWERGICFYVAVRATRAPQHKKEPPPLAGEGVGGGVVRTWGVGHPRATHSAAPRSG